VNIGSGVAISMSDVVTLAREVSGRPLATTSKDYRDFDLPRVQLDISLLQSLVDYRPRTLREGMQQVWNDMIRESTAGAVTDPSPRAQ
jgi:UDP-glucose 4-epimerase